MLTEPDAAHQSLKRKSEVSVLERTRAFPTWSIGIKGTHCVTLVERGIS